MENADEADEAYDRVHGKTLEGRRLTLEWARDPGAGRRRSRSRSGGRRKSGSADRKRSSSGGHRKKSTSRDRSRSPRKGSRSKSRG